MAFLGLKVFFHRLDNMNAVREALSIFASSFLPALISGPLAGWVYLLLWQQGKSAQRRVFWLALLLWDAAMMVYVIFTLEINFIGPGFIIFLCSPISAVITLLLLLWQCKRFQYPINRRRYFLGALLIPTLQVSTVSLAVLLVPTVCQTGLLSCSTWQ
jgi:hypothetical protein